MGITPLLESVPTGIIKKRFLVKMSSMNNGVNPIQYLVAVYDIVENNFSLKCYKNTDEIGVLISSLSKI